MSNLKGQPISLMILNRMGHSVHSASKRPQESPIETQISFWGVGNIVMSIGSDMVNSTR